jgi:hypothetical protein
MVKENRLKRHSMRSVESGCIWGRKKKFLSLYDIIRKLFIAWQRLRFLFLHTHTSHHIILLLLVARHWEICRNLIGLWRPQVPHPTIEFIRTSRLAFRCVCVRGSGHMCGICRNNEGNCIISDYSTKQRHTAAMWPQSASLTPTFPAFTNSFSY